MAWYLAQMGLLQLKTLNFMTNLQLCLKYLGVF